ncbi:MAG: beta-N-acetylhexosaminidase [Stenotrophobium sp.]
MTSKKKYLGPLMVDVGGQELTAEDCEVLAHPLVGGVILFTRNYRDAQQLRALCNDILAIRKSPRLLLAVDHEGGRVQRFRVGFSRIPAMRTLGRLHAEDPAKACEEAQMQGYTIGRELAAFGIDLCFAPVLDRDYGVSTVIGDRALDEQPEIIIALARAFRSGLGKAGMAATGKHYPGHGAVTADSHHELPVDRRALEELHKDMLPFDALIGDGIESLMMAHVRYTAVDPIPASLSKIWIGDILRKQAQFSGVIFCDDLSMGGAAVVGTLEQRARVALEAGCDMLPVCNDRPGVLELLAALKDIKPKKALSERLQKLYRREV